MTNLENRCAYFSEKNETYAGPKGVYKTMLAEPDRIVVVNVRNPVARIPSRIPSRIPGSVKIPEEGIQARLNDLPREKPILIYCWDVWCGLSSSAAGPLLSAGYTVRELHGGVKACKSLKQSMDYVGL